MFAVTDILSQNSHFSPCTELIDLDFVTWTSAALSSSILSHSSIAIYLIASHIKSSAYEQPLVSRFAISNGGGSETLKTLSLTLGSAFLLPLAGLGLILVRVPTCTASLLLRNFADSSPPYETGNHSSLGLLPNDPHGCFVPFIHPDVHLRSDPRPSHCSSSCISDGASFSHQRPSSRICVPAVRGHYGPRWDACLGYWITRFHRLRGGWTDVNW